MTQITAPDEMITEADAALMLCQSVRTLQKWRVTGYGRLFCKFGRSVRYSRSELACWISERRYSHT